MSDVRRTSRSRARWLVVAAMFLLPVVVARLEAIFQANHTLKWAATSKAVHPVEGRTLLTSTYIITGQVTFPDSAQNEVVNIAVSGGFDTTTNSDGYYTVTGLLTGTYTITPVKETGSPYYYFVFEPPTRSVVVPPTATNQDFVGYLFVVDFALNGRVMDDQQAPFAGVTIYASGLPTRTTGNDGSFYYFPVEVGTYTITPDEPGYHFQPPSLTVTVPQTTTASFIGEKDYTIYLPVISRFGGASKTLREISRS